MSIGSLLRAGVIGGAFVLWAGGAPVMAGEYSLSVDRVQIDTGDFVRHGIGYNGASPGPVLRFGVHYERYFGETKDIKVAEGKEGDALWFVTSVRLQF